MVCGFGEEVAYDTLVSKLAGAQLDKSSRFTDWARRPLSEAQIHYALGDVTHLRVIYEKLAERIEKAGRTGWVAEELRGAARSQALHPAARGSLAAAQAALARRAASSRSSRRWQRGASARRSGAICRAPASSATTCCWRWPPTGRSRSRSCGRWSGSISTARAPPAWWPRSARAMALPKSELPGRARAGRRCRAASGRPSTCCACC